VIEVQTAIDVYKKTDQGSFPLAVYVPDAFRITYANALNAAPLSSAKCPDCDADVDVPNDTSKGEILSCPGCGLELEVKKYDLQHGIIELQQLTIEGEDWGE
jgi:alpha-aminoadipate carrier protein LysW